MFSIETADIQLADSPSHVLTLQWFAATTGSCQEKRVAQHLSSRDIEFFLPVYRRISRWKNGLRVPIDRPLFPGYVFVHIDRKDRVRVLELPGVLSIVGAGREPISLPTEEIHALRQATDLLSVEPHPYLSVGNTARVCRGPMAGMTGIIARKKNGSRLIVSLELIMKSVSVEIDEQDLEPADSGSPVEIPSIGDQSSPAHPRRFHSSGRIIS